jgi:hypothetical protein
MQNDKNVRIMPMDERLRRMRRCAAAAAHTVFSTPASYFKPTYLMAIDTAVQGLRARFDQDSFATVKGLEECLLTGSVICVVRTYPEID